MKSISSGHGARGFTLLELVVAIAISTVMMGGAILSLDEMTNAAGHGSYAIASHLEMSRAQAISSTSTIIVKATDVQTIQGYNANDCSDPTPTVNSELHLNLPSDFSLSNISWSVCFSPRGFASSSATIPLVDVHGVSKQVQVFVGGGVRVQ